MRSIGCVVIAVAILSSAGRVAANEAPGGLIPSPDGTIFACYKAHKNARERHGQVRVVSDPSKCRSRKEVAVVLNQGPRPSLVKNRALMNMEDGARLINTDDGSEIAQYPYPSARPPRNGVRSVENCEGTLTFVIFDDWSASGESQSRILLINTLAGEVLFSMDAVAIRVSHVCGKHRALLSVVDQVSPSVVTRQVLLASDTGAVLESYPGLFGGFTCAKDRFLVEEPRETLTLYDSVTGQMVGSEPFQGVLPRRAGGFTSICAE